MNVLQDVGKEARELYEKFCSLCNEEKPEWWDLPVLEQRAWMQIVDKDLKKIDNDPIYQEVCCPECDEWFEVEVEV